MANIPELEIYRTMYTTTILNLANIEFSRGWIRWGNAERAYLPQYLSKWLHFILEIVHFRVYLRLDLANPKAWSTGRWGRWHRGRWYTWVQDINRYRIDRGHIGSIVRDRSIFIFYRWQYYRLWFVSVVCNLFCVQFQAEKSFIVDKPCGLNFISL